MQQHMMEDMPYREQRIQLNPGDKFYLYTDGVPEAFNDRDEMFGEERMLHTLNHSITYGDNPTCMLDIMYEEIHQFANGMSQSDDITMVYLSR